MTAVLAVALALSLNTATLDRTFVCRTEFDDLDVMASPRGDYAFSTARTISSGFLGLTTGSSGALANLVHVRARREKSDAGAAVVPEGVYAGGGRCFLSRKTVPLTSKGLAGPPVVWMKDYTCTVRGRLVVRVRAVVASAANWRRIDDDFFGVRTTVSSAQVAVRSERTGRPVAFGTLDSAGRTKLWVASGCSGT